MVLTGYFANRIGRAMLILVLLIVGLMFFFKIVPGGFVPEEDQGYIMATVLLPDGASLQRSDATLKKMQKIIAKYDAVENAVFVAGYNILAGSYQSNAGAVFVQLKDWDLRPDPEDHAGATRYDLY